MAESTLHTYLKWGTSSSTLTKKVAIKDYPDLGSAPDMIDTTTLEDAMETQIMGIQKAPSLEFTCNYDYTTYKSVLDDANKDLYYGLYFGDENGTAGKFTWQGQHSAYVVGKGKGEAREFKISIAASTTITSAQGTASA